ncbi:DUF4113 domain-containing protein [Fluviispira multicolorata]|uniref:DUF4113 domain-containing protein n=1 Tax=Fluviispira multicolorata TaxID=2654512 RepID=A0A833JFK5_9BACT|nr:DUF4113 domain-containing protein [Fluviispira multicolorata]
MVLVVDKLNSLKGASTINFGDMFENNEWKSKRSNVSNRFATNFMRY